MNLQPLPITYEHTIPESYLDSMGHMNVMWYTHLFSHATGGLFRLVGMNREYFTTQHCGSFALAQFVSYRKEVRVGEQVTLRTRVLARSAKKFHMLHYMTKDSGHVLAATCEFLGAHIDMHTRRTSPLRPEIAAHFDRLLAEHAALGWEAQVSGSMQV